MSFSSSVLQYIVFTNESLYERTLQNGLQNLVASIL